MVHIQSHEGLEQLGQRPCRSRVRDWRRRAQETINLILVVNVYAFPVVGTLRPRNVERMMQVL